MLYILYTVAQTFDWQDTISLVIEIAAFVSDALSIGLVIWGMRLFSRLRDKYEESVFGFYASFLVHLKLIKNALGENDSHVLLYHFIDAVRKEAILDKRIPSNAELEQFKQITNDTLQFLKTTDVQFSFSESVYKKRQKLLQYLIEWQNLGKFFKYGENDNDQKSADEEFGSVVELLENMINEIETEQTKMAEKFWERRSKKENKKRKKNS